MAMRKKQLCVLVVCEESQTEVTAFRQIGCAAYSLDIQRCHGGHPEWHIQEDATRILQGAKRFWTQDGVFHYVPRWDLIIAHPPCTYLCRLSNIHMFHDGNLDEVRHAHMIVAREFFFLCLNAPAKYVAVENPVPMKMAGLPRPTTYVEPYQFGHPYTKKTCLWLKNLPPLMPTQVSPERKQFVKATRARYRSRSFTGIAKAMADQWSKYIFADNKND